MGFRVGIDWRFCLADCNVFFSDYLTTEYAAF